MIKIGRIFYADMRRHSKSAKESVEKAGGSVEILEVKSYSTKAGNNKNENEDK